MFVVNPPQVVFPSGLSFRLSGEAAQTETVWIGPLTNSQRSEDFSGREEEARCVSNKYLTP